MKTDYLACFTWNTNAAFSLYVAESVSRETSLTLPAIDQRQLNQSITPKSE